MLTTHYYINITHVDLLLNIIDTPGHPEFLGQITGDLQLTDGILLVVDCIENLFEHVETILKHALSSTVEESGSVECQENLLPYKKSVVLFINKIDILLNNNAGTNDDFEMIYKVSVFRISMHLIYMYILTYNNSFYAYL